MKSEDFLLQKFSVDEKEQLPNLVREVNSIISEYLFGAGLPQDTRSFII